VSCTRVAQSTCSSQCSSQLAGKNADAAPASLKVISFPVCSETFVCHRNDVDDNVFSSGYVATPRTCLMALL